MEKLLEIRQEEEKSLALNDSALSIKITSRPTLELAKQSLANVKGYIKLVKEKREKLTKPMNDALREARDLYRPVENRLAFTKKLIDQKILDYLAVLEKQEEEKKIEIEQKVESGEMKVETAGNKLEKIAEKKGAIRKRVNRDIEIVDKTKIPLDYLEPNMVAIRKDALAGKVIPGVKVIEKTIIL